MSIPFDPRESEALKKYQRMKKVGASPHVTYRVMKSDGFWGLSCMRMLRELFPELSLSDAKGVMIEEDEGISLEEYFERLIPEIEAALDQIEEEDETRPAS